MIDAFERELTEVEAAIYEAYLSLAEDESDWVRIAQLRPLVPYHHKDVTEALLFMAKNGDIALAPDSNRKVLTKEDHDAAVKHGLLGEALHLIAFYGPADFES